MKIKLLIGAILLVLISVLAVIWYTSEVGVSIVSIVFPPEVGTQDSGYAAILLQNNASKDINVTLNVKNTIEDEKGASLPAPIMIVNAFSSQESGTFIELPKEISLKPGINQINVFYGYQVPGLKKIDVEVYRNGKFVDAKSTEVKVLPPQIKVDLPYTNESQPGYEIHKVFGQLSNSGKGTAVGVIVNISIINETTKTIVSSATRSYRIRDYTFFEPLNTWRGEDGLETQAAIAVIELSSGTPSNEKYLPALTVAKGKIGDKYRVVVTAKWQDQIANAGVIIPP